MTERFAANRCACALRPFTPELNHKMHDLLESYRALAPDDGTPDTEQVRVHTHILPIRTD
ncbi:hypothetical protein [Streptomyces pseudoechinosporeus]